MAEQKSFRGWLKTILGTLTGLISGAAFMYVTPLVDRIAKPARPLANFAVETDGLTATFHNRYTGEGWWDFGDGSPLEPATVKQDSVAHTYSKPGTYPAKLIVRNFVGEEHERAVALNVTVGSQTAAMPSITLFEATPIGSEHTAPATFRVVAQTANAERCLWDFGGDKPLEVAADSLGKQERFVTFAAAGPRVIQLVALNGGAAVRRTVTVQVDPQRSDTLVARLRVTDRGTRTEKRQQTELMPITMSGQTRGTIPIDRTLSPRRHGKILEAKIGQADSAFQNLKATIAADGKTVQITGTLSATSAILQAPTPPMIPVVLTIERHSNLIAPPTDMSAAVAIPGSASLPLPPPLANSVQAQRTMALEIRTAAGQSWRQSLPESANSFEFGGKRYTISVKATQSEVKVEVTPQTFGVTSRPK